MRLLGVVLAGGGSTRFGSDKALAMYRDGTLLDHAIEALRPLVGEVALCGCAHAHLRTIADRPVPGLGPLGGLNGALACAVQDGFDAVLSVPCDVPQLDAATLRRLLEHPARAAAFADLPVCGYWPAILAGRLERHIASNASRSMLGWAGTCDAMLVPGRGFVNVNTRADLATVQSTAATRPDAAAETPVGKAHLYG